MVITIYLALFKIYVIHISKMFGCIQWNCHKTWIGKNLKKIFSIKKYVLCMFNTFYIRTVYSSNMDFFQSHAWLVIKNRIWNKLKITFLTVSAGLFPRKLMGSKWRIGRETLHQDKIQTERRYQGQWDGYKMADYGWCLTRDNIHQTHKHKSSKHDFQQSEEETSNK